MHIPDGYLSPSTCATFYAASTPFWYAALRRVKAALSGESVPLLAVFAAFSFVVMMFNLPLPGGTTGHAVGMAMGAIVLGPEVALLAVSMALLIQALFFGDGGITALGANCFNMAIVGSQVAYIAYRLIAGQSALRSKRRVIAAGVAGYLAINAAALCAAIEFGVQPLWFRDASGAPLYAPYPLSISIPAMMIGHLTIAGLAEMVITAGLISYLQGANVAMLRRTAPAAADVDASYSGKFSVRNLWVTLGALVILTPLGLLAAGKAWGEWKPEEFSHTPEGLARLARLWQAPLAEYAPAFVPNGMAAYLFSAVLGVVLIVLLVFAIRWLLRRHPQKRDAFIEKTIRGLLTAGQEAIFAEETAHLPGFLQRFDPRVKMAGLGALIVAAVSVRRLSILIALFAAGVLCALASQVSVRLLASRVWLAVLGFTGMIALPSLLMGSGPEVWHIHTNALRGFAFLVLRGETTATFALLLILTTVWSHLLRSLRFLGVPAAAVAVVSMTYRYIFVFFESAKQTLEARQTRLVGKLEPAVERRFAAASVGALLDKTFDLSSNVYLAMQARGFRGEVRLLEDLKMHQRDWWQLAAMVSLALLALGLGR